MRTLSRKNKKYDGWQVGNVTTDSSINRNSPTLWEEGESWANRFPWRIYETDEKCKVFKIPISKLIEDSDKLLVVVSLAHYRLHRI